MDARLTRLALVVLSILASAGATHRTPNFIVNAPTAEVARQIAQVAEQSREELAVAWLGKKLPRWYEPCQVYVKVGPQMGAGGATTFAFHNGEVFGWRMNIQGSLERLLDSVVPHEVSHTILASHFRRPLPRWADEGAATLVEHESERRRQDLLLQQVWRTSKRIPLRNLLDIAEYPADMQDVMTLYAEGYSLSDYLVQQGGRAQFLKFLDDAHRRGWENAIQHHYGLKGVTALEQKWNQWIVAGSPRLNLPEGQQLAGVEARNNAAPIVRAQNTDEPAAPPAARPSQPPARTAAATTTGGGSLEEWTRYEGRTRALKDGWVPATARTPAAPATTLRPAEDAFKLPHGEPLRTKAARTTAVDEPDWIDFPAAREPAAAVR